ncbi:hypothetical protein L2Y96_06975 [Luteibacter aegosomaticola]|uniref:hypothetical protein n=1 Tax=Luteibacter aegosomaticola TaxID=2911538 RepID=UPI001FFAF70D|nr:hypothetical protein [Luteibacter aegosomaticola]UPG91504.1 hypothetical protein L2Y96_06975 [Luteibacter aegosomaticola]
MGYDVHITRKTEWFDEEGPTISIDEWKAYIASDPEIRLDGFAEAIVGGGAVLRIEQEGLAVWTGYSNRENSVWIGPGSGGITVKNPDEEILRKMFEIALALDARVIGDEGEEYGADGTVVG